MAVSVTGHQSWMALARGLRAAARSALSSRSKLQTSELRLPSTAEREAEAEGGEAHGAGQRDRRSGGLSGGAFRKSH